MQRNLTTNPEKDGDVGQSFQRKIHIGMNGLQTCEAKGKSKVFTEVDGILPLGTIGFRQWSLSLDTKRASVCFIVKPPEIDACLKWHCRDVV
jgi:hypothetical protein